MESAGVTADRELKATAAVEPPAFPSKEYAAAIAEERELRDYAFLELPYAVCGIDLFPLTFRQLLARSAMGCPFITEIGFPASEDIASFIWHLSVARHRTRFDVLAEAQARAEIIQRLAETPYDKACAEIDRYLEIALLDAPPRREGSGGRAPIVSSATILVNICGLEYGWSKDQVLDSPLAQLYQLLREINLRKNPKAIFFNRKSDKIKNDWLKARNAWLKASSLSVAAGGEVVP